MQQPIRINVSHHPAATTRITADGNCFFRSMSLVITRYQEFHQELRLLITTHMIHKSVFSSLVSFYESMEQYMKQSRMQSESGCNATIYVYAQCGDSCKWLKHEQMKLHVAVVCTEMNAYT